MTFALLRHLRRAFELHQAFVDVVVRVRAELFHVGVAVQEQLTIELDVVGLQLRHVVNFLLACLRQLSDVRLQAGEGFALRRLGAFGGQATALALFDITRAALQELRNQTEVAKRDGFHSR